MGFRMDRLQRSHRRKAFCSAQLLVDDWLATKALHHQDKHLSVTKVLLDEAEAIVGYYTMPTGQVDFGDLPTEIAKKLPNEGHLSPSSPGSAWPKFAAAKGWGDYYWLRPYLTATTRDKAFPSSLSFSIASTTRLRRSINASISPNCLGIPTVCT